MAVITIVGAGMMGSALAFPARENGNEVRLVGTHLDREVIDECIKTDKHPKFTKKFPEVVGILLNVNKDDTNVVLGREYKTLYGRDHIFDTLAGVRLKITAPSLSV